MASDPLCSSLLHPMHPEQFWGESRRGDSTPGDLTPDKSTTIVCALVLLGSTPAQTACRCSGCFHSITATSLGWIQAMPCQLSHTRPSLVLMAMETELWFALVRLVWGAGPAQGRWVRVQRVQSPRVCNKEDLCGCQV